MSQRTIFTIFILFRSTTMSIIRYQTLKQLQNGKIIDLKGIKLKMDLGELQIGDLYIAERNTGPKLLTVKTITDGIVYPTTLDYPYNLLECVKVKSADVE